MNTVLLDRDGVLNKKATQARYIRTWEEFEWLPGALEALRLLKEAGYRVIVVSNQAGIGRGIMTDEDVRKIHERMQAEAQAAGGRIDAIYYCPHGYDEGCACRKPKPGMLLQAQRDFMLDINQVVFIGDDERDGQAGAAAGCRWEQVTPSASLLDITRRLVASGSLQPEVEMARATLRSTLIVMTLNEIDGMQVIMPQIKREWVDQIIIVDGGSTDGTIEWARANGYEIYVQQQPGFRSAYQEVWPLIRGDVVIYFTPDGNSLPEVIPQLVEKMHGGADLVIASRYLGNAKSEDDDAVTRFGNWLFRTLTNVLLNRGPVRMTDPMVMLRAHRKDLPHRLGVDRPEPFARLERLFKTRVDWIPLMSFRAVHHPGIRWEEIPADEPARIGGVRKLRILQWGAVYGLQLLGEWVRPWKGNP